MSSETTAEPDAVLDFRVIRGNPTPEELAAVTAVLAAALEEETDAAELAVRAAPSGWEQSQRSIREPLDRPGGWRTFST